MFMYEKKETKKDSVQIFFITLQANTIDPLPMNDKNKEQGFVQCIRCQHATFMQWFENPVIAYCSQTDQRQVAASRRICKMFAESGIENPEIKHFDHYEKSKFNED